MQNKKLHGDLNKCIFEMTFREGWKLFWGDDWFGV